MEWLAVVFIAWLIFGGNKKEEFKPKHNTETEIEPETDKPIDRQSRDDYDRRRRDDVYRRREPVQRDR